MHCIPSLFSIAAFLRPLCLKSLASPSVSLQHLYKLLPPSNTHFMKQPFPKYLAKASHVKRKITEYTNDLKKPLRRIRPLPLSFFSVQAVMRGQHLSTSGHKRILFAKMKAYASVVRKQSNTAPKQSQNLFATVIPEEPPHAI